MADKTPGSATDTGNKEAKPPNSPPNNNSEGKKRPIFAYTQSKAWGGPTSSFGSLAFLSVFPITGFLGIDHLYLRSPMSALFKLIMNAVTLGLWYFYDMAQILTERSLVEKYGYSYPIFGPTGLGAGILTKEDEDEEPVGPSPWRFIFLCIFALLPIPFGLEYFVAGDTFGGIAKVMSNFSWTFGVLQLFSFFSGLFLIYKVFFKTESVMFEEGIPRPFPWTFVMSDDYCPKGTVAPTNGCRWPDLPEETSGFWPFVKSLFCVLKGVKAKVADTFFTAVDTAKEIAKTLGPKVIAPIATAATSAATLASQASSLESKVVSAAEKFTSVDGLKQMYRQQGGGTIDEGASFGQNFALFSALMVTIATGVYLAKIPSWSDIDVSFLLPFYKRKSGSGKDDSPPNPGAV